jgi:hypothetical protein
LTSGDFNNDKKLDLAVASSSENTVSVLLGNGNGTFQIQTSYETDNSHTSVISGDFNNDNKPDLAVTNGENTISVLLGNGDATF